jgi:hypothetical protein
VIGIAAVLFVFRNQILNFFSGGLSGAAMGLGQLGNTISMDITGGLSSIGMGAGQLGMSALTGAQNIGADIAGFFGSLFGGGMGAIQQMMDMPMTTYSGNVMEFINTVASKYNLGKPVTILQEMNLMMDVGTTKINQVQQMAQNMFAMLTESMPMLFANTGGAGGIMGEKTTLTPYTDVMTGTQISDFTRNSQRELTVSMGEAMRSIGISEALGYISGNVSAPATSSVFGTKSGYGYYDPKTMMWI